MNVGSSYIAESSLNVSVGSTISSSEDITKLAPQTILGDATPSQTSASSSSVSEHSDKVESDSSLLSVAQCELKTGDQNVGTQDFAEFFIGTNAPEAVFDNGPPDGDLMDYSSIFDMAIVPGASVGSRFDLSFMGDMVEEKSQLPVSKDDHDTNNKNDYKNTLPLLPTGDNDPFASLMDFDFILDVHDDCAVSNN